MPRSVQRLEREVLMQTLYQFDIHGPDCGDLLVQLADGAGLNAATCKHARRLLDGFVAGQQDIDTAISECATHWTLDRLPPVDRAVLRLAVTEVWHGGVPVRVALDEAIELARTYGGPDSPGFVNGLLDALFKKHMNL